MSDQSRVLPLKAARATVPGAGGERSVVQFTHGTLEVKLAALLAPNVQTPHEKDELYFVARGHGWFRHAGRRDRCETGDVLFVAAGVEHHFEDFTADFEVWVVYYGPKGGEAGGGG